MSLLSNTSNRHSIFPIVLIISVIAVLISPLFAPKSINPLTFMGLIAGFITVVLLITQELWMDGKSKYIVRITTATIALTTITAYTGWQPLIQQLLGEYFHIPNLGDVVHPAIAFSFSAFVIFVINYFNRDTTAMGIHPNPIDKNVPEPDFKDQVKMVTESLTEDLKTIDKNTNWSIQLFTPLDAEVELRSEGKEAQKKVTDLLKAIKSMKKERLFLVLGDPGSGKSVALRKLCRELADEVEKTKKIPIYINLKEWQVEKKWDENNLPTVEQLNEFVLKNIKSRDIVTTRFFAQYYDRLYENGQLYFIFDSFDEIPAVLDEKDKSPLIQELSNVMFKFLKGARQNDSQGILSSRIFRRPTDDFQTRTTLEIRPFSEEKIEQTLRRANKFSKELTKRLFKERSDLVPVARNPFMAALIADYASNNDQQLPYNQSDLYESYIHNALKSCKDMMQKRNLTEEKVVQSAIAIADIMFKDYGLEAPIRALRTRVNDSNLDDVIDILKFARIGRVGTGEDNMFSFAHRRFCEYFAVQKMLEANIKPPLDAIPNDSQWRDALVLYCEVADESKARKIANFCWEVIKGSTNPYDLKVIHSLRFLQDAFKGRLACISDFRGDLKKYVLSRISEDNIIITKLAVESLGLLENQAIKQGVMKAFYLGNEWINETAFKACWHIDNLDSKIQSAIGDYFSQLEVWELIKKYDSVKFSLTLSTSLKRILNYIHFRFIDFLVVVIFMIVWILFNLFIYREPHIFIAISLFMLFCGLKRISRDSHRLPMIISTFPLCFILLIHEKPFLIDTIKDSPASFKWLIGIIFLVCSLPLHYLFRFRAHTMFSDLLDFKRNLPRTKTDLISILILVILVLVGYSIFRFGRFEYFIWFISIFLSIISLIGIVSIFQIGYYEYNKIYTDKRKFNSINTDKCSNRAYIHNIYVNLRTSRYRSKFLTYLENNVKNVTGEWPDSRLLNMKHGYSIRLAKLEEKWLGLNK